MRFAWHVTVFITWSMLSFGCDGGKDPGVHSGGDTDGDADGDTDGDSDSDTDADSDADTDSDTDSDSESEAEWIIEEVVPTDSPLNDVWVTSENEAFMVGENGLFLHVTDGNVTTLETDTTVDLHGVWARSASDVWAVGDNTTVLHYNGSVVEKITVTGGSGNFRDVYGNTVFLWAVGLDGAAVRLFFDSSQWEWHPTPDGKDNTGVWCAFDLKTKIVGPGVLLENPNNDFTEEDWIEGGQPIPSTRAVHASARKYLWVGGGSGKVWVDYDGGVKVYDVAGSSDQFTGIHLNNDLLIFAVTEQGGIYKYENFEWSQMGQSVGFELSGVGGFDHAAYVVGDDGFIRISLQGGSNNPTTITDPDVTCEGGWCWESPISEGHTLRAVTTIGTDEAYMVGDEGTLLHVDGNELTRLDTGTRAQLNGVWARSGNEVWAVGEDTTVLFYDGSDVEHIELPSGGPLSPYVDAPEVFLDAVYGNDWIVWAVGRFGAAVKFDGSSWGWNNTPIGTFAYGRFNHGVWCADDSNHTKVVAEGAMYNMKAVEDFWTIGGQPVKVPRCIHGTWRKDLWVGGATGKIWHDIEGGPETFEIGEFEELFTGCYGNSETLVWAVSNFGKVWRYDGSAWTHMQPLDLEWPYLGAAGFGQKAYLVGYQGYVHIYPDTD